MRFILVALMALVFPTTGNAYFSSSELLLGTDEAGATAFEAIAEVFQGLAELERHDSGGSETLATAQSTLDSAIEQFEAAAASQLATIALANLPEGRFATFDALQLERPTDLRDLMNQTADSLTKVRDTLEQFRENPSPGKYSSLRRQINDALMLGEAASRIMSDMI